MNRLSPSPVSILPQQQGSIHDRHTLTSHLLAPSTANFFEYLSSKEGSSLFLDKKKNYTRKQRSHEVTKDHQDSNKPIRSDETRRLATATATIIIDTSSICSTPPSSQSYSQPSQSPLRMRYRPGSSAKGQLLTISTDSLDTEISVEDEQTLQKPQLVPISLMDNSIIDVTERSPPSPKLKGILKNATLYEHPCHKISRHVRFDGECILASRIVKADSEELPSITIFQDSDDDTDQDEDYEASEEDEESDEDVEEDDEEHSEEDEEEQETHSQDEQERQEVPTLLIRYEDSEDETDLEDIAQINKIRNQKIILDSPPSSISFTEDQDDLANAGKAFSLLSNSGFPPSSPQCMERQSSPQNNKTSQNESFTDNLDGLQDQPFGCIFPSKDNVGLKRAYTNTYMFSPKEPTLKKRCLGVRRLIPSKHHSPQVTTSTKKPVSSE